MAIAQMVIITLAVTAHLLVRWPDSPLGRSLPADLVALVDLDGERNIPAFAAGVTALGCAFALVSIARTPRLRGWSATPWLLLASTAGVIAVDELLALHEVLIPLRAEIAARDQLLIGWVLPVMVVVAAIGSVGIRVLPAVEQPTRMVLAAGAVLYAAGGLALDAASSRIAMVSGSDSRIAIAATTLEELVELIGLALVLCALVKHLAVASSTESSTR